MNANELDLYCPQIWKSDKDSRQEQVDRQAINNWGSTKKENPYAKQKRIEVHTSEEKDAIALKKALTGRKGPDEKGYTWSMGYNHLSGRYSTGGRYAELTGSSLNRNKQLKLEFREKESLSGSAKLAQVTKDLVTVVLSFAQKCRKIWGCIPQKIIDLFSGKVQPSDPEFKDWFSQSVRGSAHGLSFGVHLLSARSRGKSRIKRQPFLEQPAEIGYSVPSLSSLPSMIKQGSLF